jgi:hypothetical protein
MDTCCLARQALSARIACPYEHSGGSPGADSHHNGRCHFNNFQAEDGPLSSRNGSFTVFVDLAVSGPRFNRGLLQFTRGSVNITPVDRGSRRDQARSWSAPYRQRRYGPASENIRDSRHNVLVIVDLPQISMPLVTAFKMRVHQTGEPSQYAQGSGQRQALMALGLVRRVGELDIVSIISIRLPLQQWLIDLPNRGRTQAGFCALNLRFMFLAFSGH